MICGPAREIDMKNRKDLCLNCGREFVGKECKLWGAICDCSSPDVVHLWKCKGCSNVLGFIIDDDYCGPEKLYCHDCVLAGRKVEVGDLPKEIRGTDGPSWDQADVLQQIMDVVKRARVRKGITLLLGRRQLYAIEHIRDMSLVSMRNDVMFGKRFYEVPVVFVNEKTYVRVVS